MEPSIRVLHVDDDPGFLEVTADVLAEEDERFDLVSVTSSEEALDRLETADIDCILSDYDMAEYDGIEFLERVRERDPDLPFILFTGKGSEEVASEAIRVGVTDYLQKEGTLDQYTLLANRIDNAVAARAAQRESEAVKNRLQSFLHGTTDIITLLDEDGVIQYQSAAIEEVLGYTPEEVVGSLVFDFVHPEDRERVVKSFSAGIERWFSGIHSVEFRIRDADGSWVWLESQMRLDGRDDLGGYVVTSRDISERKEREQQLRRERERFSALFENFPGPTVSYRYEDGEPIIRSVNDAFEETFGYDAETAVGECIDDLIVPVGCAEEAKAIDERVRKGELLDRQVSRMTVDGEREFTFRNIPYREGERIDGFAVYIDIDKRVERERRLKRQNERLDEFASIIAHDMRNPLNVAQTRTDLLARECESEHVEDVRRAHDRMETLLEDTLVLARQGEMVSDRESVRLAGIVAECHEMVGTETSSVSVEDDVQIRCDPDRVRQLFENLLSNSVEHGGEDVTVRVGAIGDSGFYVEDDGDGISADVDKLFEPGYTTSEQGTGLGLAIVARIVEAHGWDIEVTEATDGGARFEISGVDVDAVW